MAEKSLKKKLKEQLKCPICLDTYTEPKLLQCFHVYCRECLVRVVIRDESEQLVINCPTCRQGTFISAKGVSGLQSAFHINPLLEIWNEHVKANGVSLEEVDDDSIIHSPSKTTSSCSEHEGKELELYCETCNELICLKCAFKGGKHHGHDSEMVEELIKQYKGEIESSLKPIEDKLAVFNESLAKFDIRRGEISDQQTTIKIKIDNIIQQLHEILDARKTILIDQLYQLSQSKLKTLVSQREQIETSSAQLSSCLDFVRESMLMGSQGDVIRMKSVVVKKVRELSNDTTFQTIPLKPMIEADIAFSVSTDINAMLRQYGNVYATREPDPSKCSASGKGLEMAVLGENSTVLMQAIDCNGEPCKKHIHSLQCELIPETVDTRVRGVVYGAGGNHYEIIYQPTVKGEHQLHIKVNDQHIKGSPFAVTVKLCVKELGNPQLVIDRWTKPYGVAISPTGDMVVSECDANSLSIFNKSGKKLCSFDARESLRGRLKFPSGVTVDSDGNILVTDNDNHCIRKFTPDGRFLTAIGSRGNAPLEFYFPNAIALNTTGNKLYVVDFNGVQILNSDLSFVGTFGKHGNGKGQFNRPWGVACDSTGRVYIADKGNHRIQVFTAEGQFLRMFGKHGHHKGELNSPSGVAIDSRDILYITELGNNRVSIFTLGGMFLKSFGKLGKGPGEFYSPNGIAVDELGVVYVCDTKNNRIQVFC